MQDPAQSYGDCSSRPQATRRLAIITALEALAATTMQGCTIRIGRGRPAAALPRAPEPAEVPAAATATPGAAAEGPRPVAGSNDEAVRQASHIVPLPKPGGLPAVRRLPPERIIIPTIGVDAKVVALGVRTNARGELEWETAAFAVGHHAGSANPGEGGNIVLSGHISSLNEGAVFKRLPELQHGHGVILMTATQSYLYQVESTRVVLPQEVSVMDPTDREQVTLITCVPDGVYTHRLIVTAPRLM
jgi:sortase A